MTSETGDGDKNSLEKRVARIEQTSLETLAVVRELKGLLEPDEKGEKDPIKLIKRYLMWLSVHVGKIEEQTETALIRLDVLLQAASMPAEATMEAFSPGLTTEDQEDEIF